MLYPRHLSKPGATQGREGRVAFHWAPNFTHYKPENLCANDKHMWDIYTRQAALINTPLQRGVSAGGTAETVFNGFVIAPHQPVPFDQESQVIFLGLSASRVSTRLGPFDYTARQCRLPINR